MHVLYPRCCGLDIHQKTVVSCVLLTAPDGTSQRFVRTFGTMTADLLALGDWLEFHAVRHVAMESTGVLWRPVFNVLEEGRTLLLVNAQHAKALPGRKTDVKDSEWLADLLRHGLLCASFIPPNRSGRCAISLGIASRSSSCGPKRSIASTKCWRRPISNWGPWPAMWSGRVDGRCCGPSRRERLIHRSWRTWPRDGYVTNCPPCGWRWPDASSHIIG